MQIHSGTGEENERGDSIWKDEDDGGKLSFRAAGKKMNKIY